MEALKYGYNLLMKEAAELLKKAGFLMEQIGHALKDIYFASIDAIKNVLNQIGYPFSIYKIYYSFLFFFSFYSLRLSFYYSLITSYL